jgi:hypothetical protein
MGMRDVIEGLFSREFPANKDVLILDPDNDKVFALHKEQTLGFALSCVSVERCLLVDLGSNKAYELHELSSDDLEGMIEVVDKRIN